MKPPLLSRKLAFERMEDRLALSATMGGDFIVLHEYLNPNQGGFVDFDVTLRAANGVSISDTNFEFVFSNTPTVQSYSPGVLNGNFQGDLGAADNDQIAPIAQPHMPGQQLGGTIELANIFLPITGQGLASAAQRQVVQAQNTADSPLTAHESQVKEPSFARGRDMYFEVASLSAQTQPRGRSAAQVSQDDLVPINHAVSAEVSKPILPSAKLRGDAAKHNSAPAVSPTAPIPKAEAEPASPPAKDELLRAAEKAARDTTTKHARQENTKSAADELSAASAHDAALAELWSDESMAEEVAISLRTNEGGKHFAAWPTLAVLVGGIIARQRRASRVSASQYPRD